MSNPGLTRFVIDACPPGTHYVAMTAYNTSGAESDYSHEVSVTVNSSIGSNGVALVRRAPHAARPPCRKSDTAL